MGSVTAPAAAPWDVVPSRDQYFVLVTGANSGIGLGIGQRLIDEFLQSRSLASHLILIISTRSEKKSQQTIATLRGYVRKTARSLEGLRSRAGGPATYDPASTEARIHLLSVELDLCNLPSICAAAARLRNGLVPRLDAVIFNAGIGGWTGVNWFGLAWQFVTEGVVQSCTWPNFKMSAVGRLVDPITGRSTTVEEAAASGRTTGELMGETFCANVFGHYFLAHQLVPLLARNRGSDVGPGRIIWESSVDMLDAMNVLSMSDFQATRSLYGYESTKRLIDVLALTAGLPRVRTISAPFFKSPTPLKSGGQRAPDHEDESQVQRPLMHISQPGVVVTPIMPLYPIWLALYRWVMLFCRWMGSPWHLITPYNGATAPVWVALQDQASLDQLGGERVKWGSSCDRWGNTYPKRTEVEGWGWDGRVASDAKGEVDDSDEVTVSRVLRNSVGRKKGAVALTPEAREDFEELGAECWKEMERLRLEWEHALRKTEKAAAA